MIPTTSKPTSVKRNAATVIDHSITNTVADIHFRSKIILIDIWIIFYNICPPVKPKYS